MPLRLVPLEIFQTGKRALGHLDTKWCIRCAKPGSSTMYFSYLYKPALLRTKAKLPTVFKALRQSTSNPPSHFNVYHWQLAPARQKQIGWQNLIKSCWGVDPLFVSMRYGIMWFGSKRGMYIKRGYSGQEHDAAWTFAIKAFAAFQKG